MAGFKNIEIINYTDREKEDLSGEFGWGRWDEPVTIQEYGAINKISISPCYPYYFAITSSTKVLIYDPAIKDIYKTVDKFKDSPFGATFRRDGKLLCVGTSEGEVKIFDIVTKTMLRILKGHTSATHRCDFTEDNYHVASFCDDKTVGVWDLPTEKRLDTLNGHTDYVRCGVTASSGSDLLLSGSYDQTVALWDRRTPAKPVLHINHGDPVEDVLLLPGDTMAVSCGGNTIKIWDLTSGGKRLTTVSPHHKTITALCLADGGQSIVSSSLDRQVKRISTSDYSITGSMSFPSSVLSVDVHPENNHVVAGMADGLVQIVKRLKKETKKDEKESSDNQRRVKDGKRADLRYLQYTHHTALAEDIIIKNDRSGKWEPYVKHLSAFQFTRALDVCVMNGEGRKFPEKAHAVIFELMRREKLDGAIAGREESNLAPLLKYIIENWKDPRFTHVLLHVANKLVERYLADPNNTPLINKLFKKLLISLNQKIAYDEEIIKLQGCIEIVLATADAGNSNSRIEKEVLMKEG